MSIARPSSHDVCSSFLKDVMRVTEKEQFFWYALRLVVACLYAPLHRSSAQICFPDLHPRKSSTHRILWSALLREDLVLHAVSGTQLLQATASVWLVCETCHRVSWCVYRWTMMLFSPGDAPILPSKLRVWAFPQNFCSALLHLWRELKQLPSIQKLAPDDGIDFI